jgi:hypothetical protein
MKIHLQKSDPTLQQNSGKIGWAILWLLGVPLPILLLFYACSGQH